jgi:hypothetical protein
VPWRTLIGRKLLAFSVAAPVLSLLLVLLPFLLLLGRCYCCFVCCWTLLAAWSPWRALIGRKLLAFSVAAPVLSLLLVLLPFLLLLGRCYCCFVCCWTLLAAWSPWRALIGRKLLAFSVAAPVLSLLLVLLPFLLLLGRCYCCFVCCWTLLAAWSPWRALIGRKLLAFSVAAPVLSLLLVLLPFLLLLGRCYCCFVCCWTLLAAWSPWRALIGRKLLAFSVAAPVLSLLLVLLPFLLLLGRCYCCFVCCWTLLAAWSPWRALIGRKLLAFSVAAPVLSLLLVLLPFLLLLGRCYCCFVCCWTLLAAWSPWRALIGRKLLAFSVAAPVLSLLLVLLPFLLLLGRCYCCFVCCWTLLAAWSPWRALIGRKLLAFSVAAPVLSLLLVLLPFLLLLGRCYCCFVCCWTLLAAWSPWRALIGRKLLAFSVAAPVLSLLLVLLPFLLLLGRCYCCFVCCWTLLAAWSPWRALIGRKLLAFSVAAPVLSLLLVLLPFLLLLGRCYCCFVCCWTLLAAWSPWRALIGRKLLAFSVAAPVLSLLLVLLPFLLLLGRCYCCFVCCWTLLAAWSPWRALIGRKLLAFSVAAPVLSLLLVLLPFLLLLGRCYCCFVCCWTLLAAWSPWRALIGRKLLAFSVAAPVLSLLLVLLPFLLLLGRCYCCFVCCWTLLAAWSPWRALIGRKLLAFSVAAPVLSLLLVLLPFLLLLGRCYCCFVCCWTLLAAWSPWRALIGRKLLAFSVAAPVLSLLLVLLPFLLLLGRCYCCFVCCWTLLAAWSPWRALIGRKLLAFSVAAPVLSLLLVLLPFLLLLGRCYCCFVCCWTLLAAWSPWRALIGRKLLAFSVAAPVLSLLLVLLPFLLLLGRCYCCFVCCWTLLAAWSPWRALIGRKLLAFSVAAPVLSLLLVLLPFLLLLGRCYCCFVCCWTLLAAWSPWRALIGRKLLAFSVAAPVLSLLLVLLPFLLLLGRCYCCFVCCWTLLAAWSPWRALIGRKLLAFSVAAPVLSLLLVLLPFLLLLGRCYCCFVCCWTLLAAWSPWRALIGRKLLAFSVAAPVLSLLLVLLPFLLLLGRCYCCFVCCWTLLAAWSPWRALIGRKLLAFSVAAPVLSLLLVLLPFLLLLGRCYCCFVCCWTLLAAWSPWRALIGRKLLAFSVAAPVLSLLLVLLPFLLLLGRCYCCFVCCWTLLAAWSPWRALIGRKLLAFSVAAPVLSLLLVLLPFLLLLGRCYCCFVCCWTLLAAWSPWRALIGRKLLAFSVAAPVLSLLLVLLPFLLLLGRCYCCFVCCWTLLAVWSPWRALIGRKLLAFSVAAPVLSLLLVLLPFLLLLGRCYCCFVCCWTLLAAWSPWRALIGRKLLAVN